MNARPPFPPTTFNARLVEAELVTPRVRRLVFERSDGAAFQYVAGQWASLVLPMKDERGAPMRRSYSIASMPDGPRFELIVTRVDGGPGSEFLHTAPLGSELEVKAPQGFFIRPIETAAPALMVATGTGIAPFRAMVSDAVRHGRREPLWLLFGCRTPNDRLYVDELSQLATEHPWFRLFVTLSQPPEEWAGLRGYVQTHVVSLFNELALISAEPHVWICGVQKMLFSVRDTAKQQLGLDRSRIHAESYD